MDRCCAPLERVRAEGQAYTLRTGEGGWQSALGLNWTGENQLSLIAEFWHDSRSLRSAEWHAWRDQATNVPPWLPADARMGHLAMLASAFGNPNLKRDNLLLRAAWTNNVWSPAVNMVYTPADRGRITTVSLAWQGNVLRVEGGYRRFDGPHSAIARNLPDRNRAYLWIKYPFSRRAAHARIPHLSDRLNAMSAPSPHPDHETSPPHWVVGLRELPVVLGLNTAIGFASTFIYDDWPHWDDNMVVSQCIGLCIYAGVLFFRKWLRVHCARSGIVATLLTGACVVFGILAGDTLAGWLLPTHPALFLDKLDSKHFVAYVVFGIGGGTIGMLYFGGKWRLTKERAAQAQRAAAEADLRALQAQVEPHFFNTLADLDALIALDPKRARVLLGHLNRYLRNSLTHSRSLAPTLGDESTIPGVSRHHGNPLARSIPSQDRLPGRLSRSPPGAHADPAAG